MEVKTLKEKESSTLNQTKILRQETTQKESSLNTESQSLQNLEITVNLVKECREKDIIGGNWTLVGLKNENSFLIGTSRNGLRLIDNGLDLYSDINRLSDDSLYDIIFISVINCYLIASYEKLYRKNIDDRPPYLYLDLKCGFRLGTYLRYSDKNYKLVINKDRVNISVIDLKAKKLAIEMNKEVGKSITDFRVFGESQKRVVSVTEDGYIILYSLGHAHKLGIVARHQLDLIKTRKESLISVSVCPKDKYAVVEIAQNKGLYPCSRMLVYKLIAGTLIKTTSIDCSNQKIGFKYALDCFGYFGKCILWVGLTRDQLTQVYYYDTERAELRELQESRVNHQEDRPVRLHHLNRKLYYTGMNGQLLSLRFILNY